MDKSLRISHVGLRGVVGAGLTAAHVIDFASAFGTLLEPGGAVIIGRDPRASGVMLRQGVIAGLLACGRDVIDLGVVPTPVIQHAIRRLDAAGGVSIGASHNTADWNALKFFGRQGTYLSTAEASELLDIYHLHKFAFVEWERVGKLRIEAGAIDLYLDELSSYYDFASLRGLRVVVDCCNGTSSLILRRANERFGTGFILINEKIEGVSFAHAPSTTKDTVGLQLAPLMLPLGADAGFLFDVDSDRVALASEEGVAVSEEMVLPLLADYLLPRGQGKLVITNLSTTALLEEIAARHGGRVLRVPVGRQAAIDALSSYRPEQIALAGEGTGAVMMPQFRFVYDGIASMLAILSMMHERGAKLSHILGGYPRYSILKAQLPLVTQRIPALLAELRERHADGRANVADGLRMDWPDRWFHVRVSQTEPVVRVICEQRGAPPVGLFESLMDEVEELCLMPREHLLKIGVSGIRGVVGEFLTPALACQFAQAFGTYVGAGRVVLGRDTRSSGPMLEHAVTCGLLAEGCEVIEVGILPTPTIQIYVASTRASGGVAITASHNPPEYNALKLFNREGLFFNNYERGELLDLYHQSDFRRATNAEIRGVAEDWRTPPKVHIARVLEHVDVERIRRRKFRVALDAVNGAGSLMTSGFLRDTLGCELHAISVDPTKPFPRVAEPRPDTLTDLSRLVCTSGAEVGFGLDPDGDRLAVLDETGRVLEPDDVLALAVDIILRRRKGNVAVNLTTSAAIDDIAAAQGCRVYRSPVGEANVVELMQATNAVIGGEGSSGGIIFPAVHLCRDSYTGIAFLLDRMAETGQSVSELTAGLPRFFRRNGKQVFEHGVLGHLMQNLEQGFPAARTDRSDGLKLLFDDGWIHVRSSNTEPLLRVAVEARSEDRAAELWDRVGQLLK